jgi:hypothetical protein
MDMTMNIDMDMGMDRDTDTGTDTNVYRDNINGHYVNAKEWAAIKNLEIKNKGSSVKMTL